MIKSIKKWHEANATHKLLQEQLKNAPSKDLHVKVTNYKSEDGKTQYGPSAYDIPARESTTLKEGGAWGVEWKFIDSEPLTSLSYEGIQMHVGKNSGRLYAITSADSVEDQKDVQEALDRWCSKSNATTTHKEIMCLVLNKSSKMLKIKYKSSASALKQ